MLWFNNGPVYTVTVREGCGSVMEHHEAGKEGAGGQYQPLFSFS